MSREIVTNSVMMPLEETISEVAQQPDVVGKAMSNNHAEVIELAREIINKGITKCVLVGSGDSMFMGLSAQQAFDSYSGIPLKVTQAYEYAAFGDIEIQKDTAIFVVSSSGRVSTTRDALDRALQSEALVVGVTDNENPDNPFFTKPERVLVPGGIKLGWPTQTTTAALAVMLDLSIQIGKMSGHLKESTANFLYQQLLSVPDKMKTVLSDNQEVMCQIAEKFVDVKTIYFVGSGPGYGVANIGGAVMAEGPQRIGVPLYVEEFHHSLRVNTLDLGMPIFLIAPSDPAFTRYLDTVQAVKNWGGYLIAITDNDDDRILNGANTTIRIPVIPYQMSPLLSVLPLHLFSIELTQNLVDQGYKRPWYSV